MNRTHIISALFGSLVTIVVGALLGVGQTTQPEGAPPSPAQLPWGTERMSKESIAVAVAYEEEWHSFFNRGFVPALDHGIKTIGHSDQMVKYLTISSGIRSSALQSDVFLAQGVDMTDSDYDNFVRNLTFLRTERSDLLYKLITGPFESKLPDEMIAETFPPNKP